MYTDEVDLSYTNVFSAMYAAKKYMIPALEEICNSHMETNIDVENVCYMLAKAQLLSMDNLVSMCIQFIPNTTSNVLKSSSFLELTYASLCIIIELVYLDAKELDIFKACMKWSEKECTRRVLRVTQTNKINMLGKALFLIHIPAIPLEDFNKYVVDCAILKNDELLEMYKFHNVKTVYRPD